MTDSDNSGGNPLASFMKQKTAEKSDTASASSGGNKTAGALKKKRDEEKEKEKKELHEAKKNSAFQASRYNQSDMTKRQAQNFLMMLPFMALGLAMVLFIVFKGGPILSKIINVVMSRAIGG